MRDSNRLYYLRQIITNNVITTQKQLIDHMKLYGYTMTQSSLSRDLTAIHAKKIQSESGVTSYVVQQPDRYLRTSSSMPLPAEPKKWFVMHVRMYHERRVVQQLQAKGIECWIPIQIVRHKWSDRIKTLEVLVITKTVFVYCSETQRRRDSFCDDTFAYLMDKSIDAPAEIPEGQMHTFMNIVKKSSEPIEFTEELLKPGVAVMITTGQFAGETAELCKYHGGQKVVVRLGGLGSAIMAVELSDIAPMKK